MTNQNPDEAFFIPELEIGEYEHYKGKKYEVIAVGLDTETTKPVVIYKPLYETTVPFWVRPYEMFIDTVEIHGEVVQRFKKL